MKILIADDHALLREGLKPLLARMEPGVVLVEAWDLASLRGAVAEHPDLDLALIDLQMPGMQGASSVGALRDASPGLPLIVLSGLEVPGDIKALLRSGAAGYIPKTSNSEVIVSAIRLVLAGGQYLPPLLLSRLDASETPGNAPAPSSEIGVPADFRQLSPRQREVIALLAQGLSNKQIARKLGLVEGTVKSHLVQIFHVLGVHNRTAAVIAAQALQAAQGAHSPANR